MQHAQRSARSVEVEKNNSEELPHVVEMVEGSPPVIATVRSAKTKRSGGGGLSLLSVRMSELGPKGENDKENIAVVETIVEEMEAERIAQSKERQPLKPSAFQPKIIPLNPGAIPSKIGKPRNPGVIPATTPLTMFKPHRVRQLAQVFTASACAAAARSPKKKAVGIVAKPRMKNLIGLRALGRLDGGNPNGA
ncbi:hypothetical protein Pmar_PMAR002316 [Perkinsus marinus ATCC 50983]|uniref:Uncharacterized protein n=1 Tax=Perkinsus marinus (strain ATCC 50983 / TXsc) TaxID=423536 RepID=C5KUZ8_PERM5|nr:hypothetical protein Pmar_PMAR002316 [Perkinsus marinus ATCC 50983]EER11713.1 hypothetical protein Pmar_PMAR002316 [Perkinsus marinus ATCC 50983]|eukprot:XP_002779918.1 hypothetical protein Pmar_PMAR002316 [Perkinsus marinus ATCC 50983]